MKTQEEVQAGLHLTLPILCALLANPNNRTDDDTQRSALVTEALLISEELLEQMSNLP